MEEYISKSALVAEIEKLIRENELYLSENASDAVRLQKTGAYSVLNDLLHFIDTLREKDIDFEEELKHYCNDYYNCDYPKQLEEETCSEVMPHIVSAAKYFFELGMAVDNKAQKGEEV